MKHTYGRIEVPRWFASCDLCREKFIDTDKVRPVQCPECGGTVTVHEYEGQDQI